MSIDYRKKGTSAGYRAKCLDFVVKCVFVVVSVFSLLAFGLAITLVW